MAEIPGRLSGISRTKNSSRAGNNPKLDGEEIHKPRGAAINLGGRS